MSRMPNKSPEPTPVGACRFASRGSRLAVRRGSAFFVRPRDVFEIFWDCLAGGDFGLRKFVGSSEAS